MAASDFNGEAVLHKNPQNKGDNRLYSDSLLEDTENIKVTSIDKLCADNNIEVINFLKIDVQGAESRAILGASKVLRNSPDCILLSEFWPYGLSRYDSSSDEYLDLLQSLGFRLFELGKKAGLSSLDRYEITRKYRGRKYTNIVGAKGKYLEGLDIA